MAHEVERMFFTGKRPWWYGTASQKDAVGVDLGDKAVTSREAIEAAGLGWAVTSAQAGYEKPMTTDVDGRPVWAPADSERFLIRNDTGAVLGRCKDQYSLFQNVDAFEFLDGLVAQGELLYHTAGSLEGGRRVWILAQTPHSWTIKRRSGREDKHHAFLNCMIGHDGQSGISLCPTDIRVECANTMAFAESIASGENVIFRVQHRGDIGAKLELAAKAIEGMAGQSRERREVLQAMAQTAMNTDEFIDFAVEVFLGLDGDDDEVADLRDRFYSESTDRQKTVLENKVGDVAARFQEGIGNEGDSALDAVNAFSEYFDHFDLDHIKSNVERGRRAAKAVTSAWVGAGAQRKALAYKRLAQRVAG